MHNRPQIHQKYGGEEGGGWTHGKERRKKEKEDEYG